MSPTEKGHVLVIPAPSDDSKRDRKITITWSQSWSARSGDYYALVAKNKNTDSDVVFFIQPEFFNDATLIEVGRKTSEGYEIAISDKFQYGEKNTKGEGRFVVLHDKSRKMYQHRFIETALASSALGVAEKMASSIGFDRSKPITDFMRSQIGEFLRTF